MKLSLVASDLFLGHQPPSRHPENPDRLRPWLPEVLSRPKWQIQFPRPATEKELLMEHTQAMIDAVLRPAAKAGWYDPDTYFEGGSSEVALQAAGASIEMATQVWNRTVDRGFALIRPPGHHAIKATPMGFCLFNNIALAGSALKQLKPDIRIGIVDFDLHHGNGTQDAFYDDPNVFFLSSHRYPYYPGTGALAEQGTGEGLGTTLNLPLDLAYGDGEVESVYAQIVLPALKKFKPEILLVSAGFDGHEDDPMQGLRLTSACFGRLSGTLIDFAEQFCGGRIAFFLEGGYNPFALRESVESVLSEMEKETPNAVLSKKDFSLLAPFEKVVATL